MKSRHGQKLALAKEPGRRGQRMWHRAAMKLDPERDLDAEILRLASEAMIYRDAVDLMERQWLRVHATEAT